MSVETLSRTLTISASSIGWINKENRICVIYILIQHGKAILLQKRQAFSERGNAADTLSQCIRIPTRENPLATLAKLESSSSRRENTTAIHAIFNDGLESALTYYSRGFIQQRCNIFRSQRIGDDPVRQPESAFHIQHSLPDSSYIGIYLSHNNIRNKPLRRHCQADTTTSQKWFDKASWSDGRKMIFLSHCRIKPAADVRYKPGLTARIAKRAKLWYRSNVYYTC